ncbi:MAG TPA: NAD(P)/FAD-dependent oxidoreductase [Acidimicrobiales bacterium]|nr:NAD(P)/FAD-dependent oxidoreductase [Acidimicrobiales bacterium]
MTRPPVAVLGAGAGGLAVAIRLKMAGLDDFAIFEASDGVGGTWRRNTYPGAACDVPSHLYSYSFAMKPDWTKTYANQPEILQYFEDCTDRFGVRPHLRPQTPVVSARWQERTATWLLRDAGGSEHEASVVVSALGTFNAPSRPDIAGLDSFAGTSFHSSSWDHSHDMRGARVGVIGTGASAAQLIPELAQVVERLFVFQRTPSWVVPRLDKPFSDEDKRRFARNKLAARKHRWEIYRSFERNITFRHGDAAADTLRNLALGHLAHRVHDEELRAKLTPDYPFGCKRTLVTSDFYKAIVRPEVELVTEPVAKVTPGAVVTADGTEREVDTLVLATGFKATEYLHGLEVVGVGGQRLHDAWAGSPRAYLGMTVSGYPNFFMLYGPNTNQGGNSIIFILEAQARYIVGALRSMHRRHVDAVDVRRDVMDGYNAALDEALRGTVWDTGCQSYFKNADGRVVTQLPYPSLWYWRRTRRFRMSQYDRTKAPGG